MYPWGAPQPPQQWGYPMGYPPAYPQTYPPAYPLDQAQTMHPGVPAVQPVPSGSEEGDVSNDPKKQKSPKLEIQGNASTMNLPQNLLVAIQSGEYFKSLYDYKAYPQVVTEIRDSVTHVEPWDVNMAASPAFCIMYKLFRMRLTERQMEALTENYESVYARAIGFLYLRLTAKNDVLWDWLSPYFYDDQEITLGRNGAKKTTIGKFTKNLLFEQKHFTLLFPRIPVPFMKKLTEQLATLEAENGPIDRPEPKNEKGFSRGDRDDRNRRQDDNRDRTKDHGDRDKNRDRNDRDKDWDRNRDRDNHDRDRDRGRDNRDRDRDNRDNRDRDRDRDYRDNRDRDRNRDRDNRDRDRDRNRDNRDRRNGDRDRPRHRHSRSRSRDRRRDRSRSRDRDDSPSRKKARTDPLPSNLPTTFARTKAPVDMKQLRDAYGDASGKSSADSKYNINPNLGAAETMRLGF